MDLEKIKGLPLEEQVKALNELKQQFEEERQKLKQEILRLEQSRKTKEGFAKTLADERRITTKAEINLIISSIKDIKQGLAAKNKELEFLQRAIDSAEKFLQRRKEELEEEEEQEELSKIRRFIDELIIRQEDAAAGNSARPEHLEEEIKKADKSGDEETLEEEVEDVRTRNQLVRSAREGENYQPGRTDSSAEDRKTYISEKQSDEYAPRNPVEEERQDHMMQQYDKEEKEDEEKNKIAAEEDFERFAKYGMNGGH